MSCIYLINVGSNIRHGARARSPRFAGGSFQYVPFPFRSRNRFETPGYSNDVRPFVRAEKLAGWATHADPDWKNLTYGDDCRYAWLRGVRATGSSTSARERPF